MNNDDLKILMVPNSRMKGELNQKIELARGS